MPFFQNEPNSAQSLGQLSWPPDGPLPLSGGPLAPSRESPAGTLIDFERGARQPYERTLADVQRALESAGIIFIVLRSV